MKFRFLLLVSFFFILSNPRSFGQEVNSFYFMKGIPQSYQINPAFQPGCNFFLGLPGLAPLKVQTSNSSFGLGDVIQYSSRIDSLVSFLHPDGIGGEEFLNRLDEENSIHAEFSTSLASFGFRIEDMYFTFDIRERMDLRMDYSDDYLRLPIIGPDSGQFFDMNMGFDMTAMNEFSMGASKQFGDLTIGVRGKLLFGQANITSDKFNMTLSTDEEIWRIKNDISVNTSAPYLIDYINFAVDAPLETIFGDIEDFDPEVPTPGEIIGMAINPRNFGLALDIGADYRMYDWLQLSASIVDFGSIKWKDDMTNFQNEAEYDYEGVEVYISDDNEFVEDFLDSLETTFDEFTVQPTEYRNFLPTKIYMGGAVYPHPKISFGLLSRTDIYKGELRQQFTASANLYPIRMLSTTFSYSIINSTYKNIGFGLALNAFPFNFYLLTDTGPSVYFFPLEAKYFNLKIGMNIAIGCKKEKEYDVPLID